MRPGFDDVILILRYDEFGQRDLSFGDSGEVFVSPPGGQNDRSAAIAVGSNGEIVVGGSTWDGEPLGQTDFLLLQITPNQFGGFRATTNIPDGNPNQISDLLIQTDGKIVVVGNTVDTVGTNSGKWVLARYNDDGSLDGFFGSNGMVISNIPANDISAKEVALQPDGKILVGGNQYLSRTHHAIQS